MEITKKALKDLGFYEYGFGKWTNGNIILLETHGIWAVFEGEDVYTLEQILGYMVYRNSITASRFVEIVNANFQSKA